MLRGASIRAPGVTRCPREAQAVETQTWGAPLVRRAPLDPPHPIRAARDSGLAQGSHCALTPLEMLNVAGVQ